METALIMALAVILDLLCGEPPNRFHPVAWLGSIINRLVKLRPASGNKRQFAFGSGAVLIVAGMAAVLIWLLVSWLQEANTIAFIVVAAVLLKLTFSLRGLKAAALQVKQQLKRGRLPGASLELKALVSRDTGQLSQEQMISAAVESVAENSCDSFTAPLLYFLIFGLPGAVAYRVINTFDAMIGYHGTWEYTGKFAARLDDIVNYIPARITAIIAIPAALITGNSMKRSWQIMARDHAKTESPNAGWTMSAFAGAMGIQLEKPGHYRLGDHQHGLSLNDIDTSVTMLYAVAGVWIALVLPGVVAYTIII